jgi:hypothetical protein
MARPLRIEFQGALHHVMARGNARSPIVDDDDDRQAWVDKVREGSGLVLTHPLDQPSLQRWRDRCESSSKVPCIT